MGLLPDSKAALKSPVLAWVATPKHCILGAPCRQLQKLLVLVNLVIDFLRLPSFLYFPDLVS